MPLYFLAEVVVAMAWPIQYDVTSNSISNLGDTTCDIGGRTGSGAICSPLHLVMNLTFITTGVLVAVGAIGLRELVPAGVHRTTAVFLLVVGGISCALVGLVPVNVDPALHWIVAAPTFLARNVAMGVVAWPLIRRWRCFGAWTVVCATAGTVGIFSSLLHTAPFGIAERLALYPFTIWAITAGVAAIVLAPRPASETSK
ncbi:DUF998 domain-containing protein [Antrihabitans sp. YC2-6]|uniref:DUF998 domain-containing protein n=1 Tax=Antrihabitans sp. YC2-6 TaxID=2799498 RepID=UPI0018F319DE|nr:DUF998 domain-containing protein [Antrihabitans sp. YC2-6]MBJ8343071.1 DUF998 domain-containing protein [Antrihabitans sp. YC2-6]